MSTISASTTSTTAYKVTADTTGTLVLQTGSTPTTAVTIDTSQNVGIGTTSPANRLSIGAGSFASATSQTTGMYTNGTSGLVVLSDAYSFNSRTGTGFMNIDSSGNLGVGTTSPATRLVVGGSTGNYGLQIAARTDFASLSGQLLITDNTGSACMYTASGALVFATGATVGTNGGTERARIDSSGNLLVGTASNWFGRNIISDGSGGVVGIVSDITNYSFSCLSTPSSGNNLFIGFWTESRATPTFRGAIDYNRGAGQIRYNTTSDATLKNIIGDADGTKSVDILKSTRIREYSWKEDQANKPQIGVIAQELHETFSGAVSVGGDKVEVDEEGNETTRYIPWAVDKTAFTFHLVAGWQAHEKIIQEQQAIIETLTNRITALEAK